MGSGGQWERSREAGAEGGCFGEIGGHVGEAGIDEC